MPPWIGDTVLVTNGMYASGGRALAAYPLMTNRVCVDRAITLRSVNGPDQTVIQGYKLASYGYGEGAIRALYLTNGAFITGFTLTNGATRASGDTTYDQSGAGILAASTNAVVSNCIVIRNASRIGGGGTSGGTINNCSITRNSSQQSGGGAYMGTLNNCTVTLNYAKETGGGVAHCTANNSLVTTNLCTGDGGGAYVSTLCNSILIANRCDMMGWGAGANNSKLTNCTVVYNTNFDMAAGLYVCYAFNCIIYYNVTINGSNPNFWSGHSRNCCTAPGSYTGWTLDLVTNEPGFVDVAAGNWRLQSNSPCINAGNFDSVSATDLDGNPRLVGGAVDIGAYEFQTPTTVISYAWLRQYGLPTDGTADFTDPDGDGFNNFQEWHCGTDPTNALSSLRLLPPVSDGINVTLAWTSALDRMYFVEYSPDLSATPRFLRLSTNLYAAAGITTFIHTNAVTGAGTGSYRVTLP